MNEMDYVPKRRWNWTIVILVAMLLTVIIGFMMSSRPAPGWMAHATPEELNNLYTRRPQDSEVGYYFARSLMQDGELDRAYTLMTEIVNRNPQSTRYLERLAQCAASRGHAAETVDLYKRIISLDAHNADPHSELGHIYTEAGLLTDGLHEFDEAIKLNPKVIVDTALYSRCLIHAGRYEEAWQRLIPSFNAIPRQDDPYEDMTKAGIKLQNFDETEKWLIRRMSMDMEYPLCRFQYCQAQLEMARPRTPETLKNAETFAYLSVHDQRATKDMHPIKAQYFAFYAHVLEEIGRTAEARAALMNGLKLDPANKECLLGIMRLCERTHDPKAASWQQAYWKATGENAQMEAQRHQLETNPNDTATALALASELERQKRFGEAEDLCYQVLSSNSKQEAATAILERCRTGALRVLEAQAKKTLGTT